MLRARLIGDRLGSDPHSTQPVGTPASLHVGDEKLSGTRRCREAGTLGGTFSANFADKDVGVDCPDIDRRVSGDLPCQV
jgi:hypothetical protein